MSIVFSKQKGEQSRTHASCAALQLRLVWLKARRLSHAGAAADIVKEWLPQLGCWVARSRRQLSHLAAHVALILQSWTSAKKLRRGLPMIDAPLETFFFGVGISRMEV